MQDSIREHEQILEEFKKFDPSGDWQVWVFICPKCNAEATNIYSKIGRTRNKEVVECSKCGHDFLFNWAMEKLTTREGKEINRKHFKRGCKNGN